MKQLISVDEAVALVLADCPALPSIYEPLSNAAYRILAQDLYALRTQPPFRSAAMDGYAIFDTDAEQGKILRQVGISSAGRGYNGVMNSGECVRIFTGAPVPQSATTVVMQEDVAVLENNMIRLERPVEVGRHIRAIGLDFGHGDRILSHGSLLDSANLAFAAAAGHAMVPVVKKPKLAIIATGDELVLPGKTIGPDQIIASNSFGIAALARQAGADILDLGIVPDDKTKISAAITNAFESGANILVTLGGASVGDHDLVKPGLADLGVDLGFWQIAMRPGKPLMHGRYNNIHVLGLPGNPVSSLVCAHLFLLPLIAKMRGSQHHHRFITAILDTAMRANDHRQDYVRAIVLFDETGQARVNPFSVQDSSMLSTLARANGLIVRPPHATNANIGDNVTVLMLR